MKVDDTFINKEFVDFDEGECFVTEYGSYYMKIRDHADIPQGLTSVIFKAVNLENGCVTEFNNDKKFRPVNAKAVIE